MVKKRLISLFFSIFALIYFETVVRVFTLGSFDIRFVYPVLFAIPVGGFLFLLTLFTDKLFMKIIYNVIIAVLAVYFSVQLVYYDIFQGFLSLSLVGMGGDAMTNFAAETLNAIKASAVGLVFLLLPIPAYIFLTVKKAVVFKNAKIKLPLITAGAVILAHLACLGSLYIGGTGAYTVYDAYHSSSTGIDSSVQNLGVFVTARIELQNMLLGKMGIDTDDPIDSSLSGLNQGNSESTGPITGADAEGYHLLDLDFDKMRENTEPGTAPEIILTTVENRTPTKKNEYTGMFEGYNLITICAESFSYHVIDKELTPTLYKLSTEGFVMENFYGSFESVTTDGEFTYCLGMFPDLSRGKYNSSFVITNDNALPYALGNVFRSMGADTYAYHNNVGTYYGRDVSHPTLGYEFKTPDNGLDMEIGWPSSDYDMMVASVDDYISSGEQFHAYYMTFSGHHQYNWSNPMSKKNKEAVDHLDYSDTVKAYIAANLEVEKALTYLLERLEEEGIADKTVIVLTTDHYPYGLSEENFNELAGKEIDPNFEKYKNSFILWNGGMEEPVKVDKLCSTVDILPTILNLFGYDYDSRFLIGRDVLSEGDGFAILANQSFITKDYMFNAVDNEIVMLTDKNIPEDEINKMKNFVVGTVGLSKSMLNTDIFSYLEDNLAEAEK